MDQEKKNMERLLPETDYSKRLKIFGIVAIVLGIAKLVARLVIYMRFDVEKFLMSSPNSDQIIKTLEENKTSLKQVQSSFKAMIITYAVIGLIVLLVIGILAIKGSSSGNTKGLKVFLIIYLVYTVLALLFSFGVHTVIGVFGIVTIIIAIFGIIYASKVGKQQM